MIVLKKYLVLLLLVAGACSSDESSDKSKVELDEEIKKNAIEEVGGMNEEDEEKFNFVMPSAMQITSIFSRSDKQFSSEVVNDISNAKSYITKVKKLFNLGIYTSDLTYSVLNNQSQLSIEYLRAVKQLSEEVGMAAIFNSGPLFERFEKYIGDKDSIINIMADLQESTDLYVKRSDQEDLAMVVFAGAWVEGMHIGMANAGDLEQGSDIVPRIVEQMTLLSNLITGLELQPSLTDELKNSIQDIRSLRTYFENIDGVDLEMFEYDLNKITNDHLNEIKSKVEVIRTNMINTNS